MLIFTGMLLISWKRWRYLWDLEAATVYGILSLLFWSLDSSFNGEWQWRLAGSALLLLALFHGLVFKKLGWLLLVICIIAIGLPRFPIGKALAEHLLQESYTLPFPLFSLGLLLFYAAFHHKMPRDIGLFAALLLAGWIGVKFIGFLNDSPWNKTAPVIPPLISLGILTVILSTILWLQCRDGVITTLLLLPFLIPAKHLWGGLGGWQWMILGFILLAGGVVWRLHAKPVENLQIASEQEKNCSCQ